MKFGRFLAMFIGGPAMVVGVLKWPQYAGTWKGLLMPNLWGWFCYLTSGMETK